MSRAGARDRRRRLHRLEPRAGAARARRRRARARQLLDRQPRATSRASTSRSSRASCARYERVHNAVRGAELVFHLGALGSVPRSVQDPLTTSAVNVEGTLNVLLAARDEGVRRVVFASSSSVYGSAAQLPARRVGSRRPDLALRRRQARRRALLRLVQPRLRVVRDGRAALLQRLRPAPEPALAVRGRRAAVHDRDRRRGAGHDLRRRRAVARLHLRRERRRREPARGRGDGRDRPDLQRRRWTPGERQHAGRHDRTAARPAGREDLRAAARRRPSRLAGRHRRGAGRCWDSGPRSASRKGCAGPRRRCSGDGGRADPGAARDRPAEHGRAGAPRRLPDRGARDARLRHDARHRLARARRGVDGVRRRGEGRPDRAGPAAVAGDLAGLRRRLGQPARLADPRGAAARPAHAHREGGRGRARWPPCSPATRGRRSSSTPSTDTSCAATSARSAPRSSAGSSGGSPAHVDDARGDQPGGARRPRRARDRAAGEVRARPPRRRARPPPGRGRRRRPRADAPASSASRTTASSSAGSAA